MVRSYRGGRARPCLKAHSLGVAGPEAILHNFNQVVVGMSSAIQGVVYGQNGVCGLCYTGLRRKSLIPHSL